MDGGMNFLSKAMRTIAAAMEKPVIVLLLFMVAVTVFMIGWLIAEFFTERRHLRAKLPALVDQLNTTDNKVQIDRCIESSELLYR